MKADASTRKGIALAASMRYQRTLIRYQVTFQRTYKVSFSSFVAPNFLQQSRRFKSKVEISFPIHCIQNVNHRYQVPPALSSAALTSISISHMFINVEHTSPDAIPNLTTFSFIAVIFYIVAPPIAICNKQNILSNCDCQLKSR